MRPKKKKALVIHIFSYDDICSHTKAALPKGYILIHICSIYVYLRLKTKNWYTFLYINIYLCYNYLQIIFKKMTPEAERFNGWAAMLGFVAAVGAYVTTGQIIPGWF